MTFNLKINNQCHTVVVCVLDRMVVGFTTINAMIAYHHWGCEFESRSE
jgi:hypothetical protein